MRTTLALTLFELKKLWRQKKNLIGGLNVVLINGMFILGFILAEMKRGDKPVRGLTGHVWNEFLNVNTYTQVILALTYDHRTVDGREAVQFLVHVKDLIEDPARLLLLI
jgi:hypothetical protein